MVRLVETGNTEQSNRIVTLPIAFPYSPMEALQVDEPPVGPEWHYEPKWDGFRCLVFRDGVDVKLQSKSGRPLTRYSPNWSRRSAKSNREHSCSMEKSLFWRMAVSPSIRSYSEFIRLKAASGRSPLKLPQY